MKVGVEEAVDRVLREVVEQENGVVAMATERAISTKVRPASATRLRPPASDVTVEQLMLHTAGFG